VHSFIRGVTVGTRPDVQRRRAKNMLEKYGAVKAVTGAAVSVP
jgi:histone acetyltransferase (RNA polymerase elongator complex component)